MEEIMNAGTDSIVFYRLIGEQRKRSNTHLQTLVANGTELEKSNRKAMNMNWSNQKANPTLKTKTGNK